MLLDYTLAAPSMPRSVSNHSVGESTISEWSSAVGHAATGKSGRVIHNLQEEIARLRRECDLYRSKAEELQRAHDAYKTQLQNADERLRNYEQLNETNLASIARKDRRIEELREELQIQKDRRLHAEAENSKAHQMMAENRDEFNRKCAELQESTNHARTQYDVLAKSGQRERAEYQKRFKAIREEFSSLKEAHEKKDVHLQRLDAIIAQKNREIEAGRESFEKLFQEYENYRKEQDEQIRAMVLKGQAKEAEIDAALASIRETEAKMKWAIQVKKEVKGSD